MNVEFTDRYGGNAPSWLRGCHGDCEAMGVVPIVARGNPGDPLFVWPEKDAREIALWNMAHVDAGEHDCDGWHFVKCDDCGGSGRVSWLVTVARVPRWLVKGVRFARFAMRREISPPDWTFRQRFANYLNAAFLADLRSLRR